MGFLGQFKRHGLFIISFSLLILLLTACDIGVGLPGSGDGGTAEPLPTTTPLGDTIDFSVPYTTNLEPGETIAGTSLTYVGPSANGYDVIINGQTATKQVGDSFSWSGILAPGVRGNYNLRLILPIGNNLQVGGQIDLTVFSPQPVELDQFDKEGLTEFSNIIVNYRVPASGRVPASSLTYLGFVDPGGEASVAQRSAEFDLSADRFPYFALGDSLIWQGQLRENVYLRYNLRVGTIDENGLRVGGVATIWLDVE
ncbi:MAG TPA: hypothetical protein VLL52_23640 [Anaerolineae bacterium]|nr:hypothetical protein [Anaerolineae bacterium]